MEPASLDLEVLKWLLLFTVICYWLYNRLQAVSETELHRLPLKSLPSCISVSPPLMLDYSLLYLLLDSWLWISSSLVAGEVSLWPDGCQLESRFDVRTQPGGRNLPPLNNSSAPDCETSAVVFEELSSRGSAVALRSFHVWMRASVRMLSLVRSEHAQLAFMDMELLKMCFSFRGLQDDSSTPWGGLRFMVKHIKPLCMSPRETPDKLV